MTQLIRSAVVLCSAETTRHFEESLKLVASIEMRYFDWRGKLIAMRRFQTQPMRRSSSSKS
jgi:hypothetical protein